jgi:methylated-DNA-[protein]-cysteine S-methyltransferase
MNANTSWDVYESPLGPLTVHAGVRGLTGLSFPGRSPSVDELARDPATLRSAVAQLDEYFSGRRQEFELELELSGTPLQHRVWRQLQEIPYGTTITYTELARSVGRPDIVRAVAAAVGKTPVPIIIPCHRVIAADGALTGYLGGLQRKQALLDHECNGLAGLAPLSAWTPRQLALL